MYMVKQGNDNHVKLINKAATQIHLGELCGLSIHTEMSFKMTLYSVWGPKQVGTALSGF